jgi:Tol biopolymer transport system component
MTFDMFDSRRVCRTVASILPLSKQISGRFALAILALAATAGAARAQAPDEDWRTLATEHFRVTFPSRLESLGRRAATVAEVAYAELATAFIEPPSGTIDLVVTDHTDGTNGFARIVPSNQIVVFARPPVEGPNLSYFDDWMELVVTHELAHIVHLDAVRNPIGRLLRGVLGRADSGWPYFPGTATPGWTIEGLATWYESDLTASGRVNGTFHDAVVRTAVLEGRFESLGQAGGDSPLWPGASRPYFYGSLFFGHLLVRFGEDRMGAFVEAVAGQWIPYRLNSAARTAFGISLSQAWSEWGEELRARYALLDSELARTAPVTEPQRLTHGARWGFHPSVSPDGTTLVYVRADGRSDIQLTRQPVGGDDTESEAVSRTNGLATYGWMPDGRLLVAQIEQDGPHRAYSDLYAMDLQGASERITYGQRLEHPSVAPDGRWAVAMQNGDGTNALARVELESGRVTTLVPADPDVHWAFPRISPNGRWIAVTRWEPGAYQDVVILDATDGRELSRITRDRAVDLAPAWSPDSRWVVWSSDRTGIPNILGASVDASGGASTPRLLTNVRTAALYPSISPDGSTLYFSGHHVDGWEAERTPFSPESATVAPSPLPQFSTPPSAAVPPAPAAGEVEDYSIWPTLLPKYWMPRLREPVEAVATESSGVPLPRRELLGFGIGAETSGFDVARRHAYGTYAQIFTSGGEFEAGLAYSYRGLGNPIFSVRAEQLWRSGGQFVSGAAPDTLYVLTRQRSVDASVGITSARWRRTLSLTLGGGLIWEAQDVLESDLERSDVYVVADPRSRLGEARINLGYASARSFSFQTGDASGLSAAFQARARRDLALVSGTAGIIGIDDTFADMSARVRAYLPLWRGGHARHVLALQVGGGAAWGAGAQRGHFVVGGASGSPEDLTGFELFGGSSVFLPVRGYQTASRYGRFAWATTAEYRFPIALLNWGLGAWPLHFDRVTGSLFVDAGDAWGPYPRFGAVASAGAEVTVGVLAWFNTAALVRSGVAVPWVGGGDPEVYVRMGLPF